MSCEKRARQLFVESWRVFSIVWCERLSLSAVLPLRILRSRSERSVCTLLMLTIMPVGCPIFAHPSARRTSTCLFLSLWTASSSMKTNCVADRRNSEFWQRIGQPYMRNPGRCFVAVVEIETDRCAVCLAELDAVQSEADIQANVRCPTPFWSGTRAGNKQSPDDVVS